MAELFSRLEVGVPAGALAGALLILFARTRARGEVRVYGIGLVVTAFAYVLFGLRYGASPDHLRVEAIGAVLFAAAAVLGVWRWPAILALGWSAHVIWDLVFHHSRGPASAPVWYPVVCVGFDLFVGGYIAGLLAERSGLRRREPPLSKR